MEDFTDLLLRVKREMDKTPQTKKPFDRFISWYIEYTEGKKPFTSGIMTAFTSLFEAFDALEKRANYFVNELTKLEIKSNLRPDISKKRKEAIASLEKEQDDLFDILGCDAKNRIGSALLNAIHRNRIKEFNSPKITLLTEAESLLDTKCTNLRQKRLKRK